MIRIGVELNGIVRDINTQVVKYYKKDIDKDFDDKDLDKNVLSVIDSLKFESKKKKEDFLYIDYPFEVYGCAKTMSRHLANTINNWIEDLNNNEDEKYSVGLFSLMENALTIQSTYYFLGKIGCRVREMYCPMDGLEMWDKFDIIVTTNERLVKNKPEGKKVVLIKKNDNLNLASYADYSYEKLEDVIENKEILNFGYEPKKKTNGIFAKIKKVFKR